MRPLLCLLCAATAAMIWPGLACAHHARVGVGVYFGPGIYYPPPYYYPPPVYYPQPPVVIQQPAPVYVEQAPAPAAPASPTQAAAPAQAAQASSDWFYCASSKTYYPYTKECPEPWQRVSPVPPSMQGR